MTFEAYLEARRKDVETALQTWLPRPPKAPDVISEAMRYSLLGGGKRLRPMLVIASAEGVAQVARIIRSRGARRRPARRLRDRNDPYLFVDPRRSARDGR